MFQDGCRFLQPLSIYFQSAEPQRDNKLEKETSYPQHSWVTMWEHLCYFMFESRKVTQMSPSTFLKKGAACIILTLIDHYRILFEMLALLS